ncbi:efflux RND transporter permease subunit [Labilithrix luteola]|uniref:efflux RND transporter permease subunit n=1 Tax=Labilithrix luteola TaxID=1391654 RepID=UPI0011BA4CEB|nr:MMPL family transporter [Labilithrix luteola]
MKRSAGVSATKFLRGLVDGLVDLGGRRPWFVILSAVMILGACWNYARHLQVRSDVLELLPRESPGFQAFERRIERVGGRATIVILAESPDRAANEHLIDALHEKIETSDVRPMISSIEAGTKDVKKFFEANKWLYATVDDLEEADAKLDQQIAIKSGMVEDLEDKPASESALGMDSFKEKFEKKAKEKDDFPTGYFASPDGTQIAMRIFTTTSGMGGGNDEQLFARIRQLTEEVKPTSFHPDMKVGFGGDIPNAEAEKESLVHEAMIATLIAAALILGGVVWFYGSPWALVLVGFPPLFGVGCAYAFATYHYGYVNASGAFLGAIILGNGVNYPIVLYSRYKEFRARGMSPEVARRDAVWNAFRAELVGATVASIAYGSLTVTRFRGFSQFGVIGFVGMFLVWISMIPCLPALIVIIERLEERGPKWLRERPAALGNDESRGPVARFVGNFTEARPRLIVGVAMAITVITCIKLPSFIRDPWEYDFDKLGSQNARKRGAFVVSGKADKILSGRMNLAGSLVLADHVDQVPMVKQRILENDAADPKGAMIEGVTTVNDFLPGNAELQKKKLAVLDRLRERITPRVLASLSEEEQEKIKTMIPPESLRELTPVDLPGMLKDRFSEKNGTVGTVFYVRYKPEISRNDGHNMLRMSSTLDGVRLPDGTQVDTASRATIFAEMIRSMERDGPLATGVAFLAVAIVVIAATSSLRGAFAVLLSLVLGVVWMLGSAALFGERLNFLNFIALPITFGIGSEYPFNIFDRSRLLGGDVTRAVKLHLGAVALCSYTTTIGYGSLLFADNQALRSFGRLAIGGEIACFLVAIFFLPSLLHLIGAHTINRPKKLDMTKGAHDDHGGEPAPSKAA